MVVLALAAGADEYFPQPEADAGWRKNTDEGFIRSLGLDPEGVRRFGSYNLSIANDAHIRGYDYHKYRSALVIKDGWIVGEWYNRPDGAEFMTYMSSVGKTVALACFGIMQNDGEQGAVEHGLSPASRVYDRRWLESGFPLSDTRKSDITFDQVFQHTSGICPQITADGVILEKGRDRWTTFESWVVGHDRQWPQTSKLYFSPGRVDEFAGREVWGAHEGAYSSVGFAHLGLVIRNVYGIPASQFLWERLLQPLGFSGVGYHKPPDPPAIKWFTAGGLTMTTRDFGRFAYFLLHEGHWRGQRMVPAGWFEAMRATPNYPNLRSNVDGYFGAAYPRDMFRVFGSGGNFAFIVPGHDLIAIRTGRVGNYLMDILQRDFLRTVFLMIPGHAME